MEKNTKKMGKKTIALITLAVVIFVVAFTTLTYAWFTDRKSFVADLSFGDVSIVVDDTTTEDKSSTDLCLALYRDKDGSGNYEKVSKNANGKYSAVAEYFFIILLDFCFHFWQVFLQYLCLLQSTYFHHL